MSPRVRSRPAVFAPVRTILLTTTLLLSTPAAFAQDTGIQPGEAYVTRFSGTRPGPGGAPVIDPGGTSGGIIDVRAPGRPPLGQHWLDEPQRLPVTAAQVGQVFGVTLDDARPPNVYLTATSAFGLHRAGNDWMPGMWGQGGGPGTVYRLDASTGYAPRVFAQITLNGRPNSAAALGNIAYDRANRQLFVSDLETGMIHRIRAADGGDLGFYDHGTQGRAGFTNAEDGQRMSLPPIAFDPNSRARIADCPSRFDNNPQCWNFAASGRRVWGVGVRRDAVRGETRLFYAVWSSPAFGQTAWNQASEDEKRNSVWSVRLGPDGGFDTSDVRREFILPDFFVKPQDIARAGMSQPVSDIAFAECGQRPVMLIAERGGIRNLGLAAQNPFADPHEARPLRYELDDKGTWRAVGRYDVGFYDRSKDGAPFMRANCAGGIAFGLGYDSSTWVANPGKPDQFVWITGDSLCSPDGPCNLPGTGQPAGGESPQQAAMQAGDVSEVHGIEGLAENAFEQVAPDTAFAPTPPGGDAAAAGPNQAYLIDTDINVDGNGQIIPQELVRNDATKIGDIAIYQVCEPPTSYSFMPAPLLIAGGHPTDVSHARYASHDLRLSHYRWGSHDPFWSHNRWGSHYEYWSHNRLGSHERQRSHWRYSSDGHDQYLSHRRYGSHNVRDSRQHSQRDSREHSLVDSRQHLVALSRVHLLAASRGHSTNISQQHALSISQQHAASISRQHSINDSIRERHSTSESARHSTSESIRQRHTTSSSGNVTPHSTAISKRHTTAISNSVSKGVTDKGKGSGTASKGTGSGSGGTSKGSGGSGTSKGSGGSGTSRGSGGSGSSGNKGPTIKNIGGSGLSKGGGGNVIRGGPGGGGGGGGSGLKIR